MGKSWLSALLFSIVVSVIFAQVFSYAAEMSFWMSIATFLTTLLLFFGIIILGGRRHGAARADESAELRRLQAYDLKEEDDQ